MLRRVVTRMISQKLAARQAQQGIFYLHEGTPCKITKRAHLKQGDQDVVRITCQDVFTKNLKEKEFHIHENIHIPIFRDFQFKVCDSHHESNAVSLMDNDNNHFHFVVPESEEVLEKLKFVSSDSYGNSDVIATITFDDGEIKVTSVDIKVQ